MATFTEWGDRALDGYSEPESVLQFLPKIPVQRPLLQPIRRYLALILTLGLTACARGQTQPVPTPLPQDPFVQVYTNHEPASSYTEPYRNITRSGDNLEQQIVDAITSAQTTVDVAVQELRLPRIAQALVDRQKAGVKVRVILENTYSQPFSAFTVESIARLPERERGRYTEARRLIDLNGDGELGQEEINQRDALVMLRNAKIPLIDDTADGSAGSNLMHHKFVVVDDHTVIVTSANFTTSDVHGDFKAPASRGNANNLLKIDSSELAALFTQEFNAMWGDGPGGKLNSRFGVKKPYRPARQIVLGATTIEVQFSPTPRTLDWDKSSNGLIGKTLNQASQSIEMALFVFSDQRLVNLLEPLPRKKVQIRTLIDPEFAYRSYSEGLDMLGITLTDDCKLEAGNRPWQTPITTVGVPRMPPGDLLHNKFGIVDRQTVITGSHNWTDAANTGNDETLLVIHSPTVAAHYEREFERLYSDAVLGVPPAIRKKASAQQKHCDTVSFKPQPSRSLPTSSATRQQANPVQANRPDGDRPPRKTAIHRTQAASGAQDHSNRGTQPVNLNTATQAELEALPGVGPALAKRIIAARQQKPFTSLADLDQVSGVGPKLLRKLESHVTW